MMEPAQWPCEPAATGAYEAGDTVPTDHAPYAPHRSVASEEMGERLCDVLGRPRVPHIAACQAPSQPATGQPRGPPGVKGRRRGGATLDRPQLLLEFAALGD